MERRKLVARINKSDLPNGAKKKVLYPPFHVLIVNLDGVPYAIDDTCNHAGDSLARGDLDGCNVSCPAHGYLFDVRTGQLVEPVGLCDAQRTFEVASEGDEFVIYDHVLELVVPNQSSGTSPSDDGKDEHEKPR
jgi:3-phenylpropionate/trans-cinnamate dioxygenase ferredoxin subunit